MDSPTRSAPSGGTVLDVVRDVVSQAAPAETALVASLSRTNGSAAIRRLARKNGTGKPLGFGLSDLVVLATPIVWIAVEEVVQRVTGAAVDRTGKRLRKRLRRMFRRGEALVAVPPLTLEQIAEVRRRVLELAAAQGMEPERAAVLADCVVARLLLNSPERPVD